MLWRHCSYLSKSDSITISIWNQRKIHKKNGSGFLGCCRIMSNVLSRLKNAGFQRLDLCRQNDAQEPVRGESRDWLVSARFLLPCCSSSQLTWLHASLRRSNCGENWKSRSKRSNPTKYRRLRNYPSIFGFSRIRSSSSGSVGKSTFASSSQSVIDSIGITSCWRHWSTEVRMRHRVWWRHNAAASSLLQLKREVQEVEMM